MCLNLCIPCITLKAEFHFIRAGEAGMGGMSRKSSDSSILQLLDEI